MRVNEHRIRVLQPGVQCTPACRTICAPVNSVAGRHVKGVRILWMDGESVDRECFIRCGWQSGICGGPTHPTIRAFKYSPAADAQSVQRVTVLRIYGDS